MANANVGDRPQIEDDDDDDDDDLFGDSKLNSEGKKLRRMMKERGGMDDYDSSDSVSFLSCLPIVLNAQDDDSDSTVTVKDEKSEKGKEKEDPKSAPPSVERPSRPPSRGPGHRNTSSPTGRRPNQPVSGKATTAPPGAGFISVAQRATRDDSPRRSRGNSPANVSHRAQSPDNGAGRAMSPPSRGGSPSRAQSPQAQAGRGTTPVNREGSPAVGGPPRPNGGKRKTTESPHPSAAPSPKRKPSPSGSTASDQPRSKKKKSSTPDEHVKPFEGQITFQEVSDYFKSQSMDGVPMKDAIAAFRQRILDTAKEHRATNQGLFLRWVERLTTRKDQMLVVKPEYR